MTKKKSDSIRYALPADAEALADVHITSWQFAYRGILEDEFLAGLSRTRRAEWWATMLEGGARVLVADSDGVVGFCHAGASDDEGWGEVFAIYVHPGEWGRGHGHRLIRAGCSQLVESGHERALLWVLEANQRARAFYEREDWQLGKPWRMEDIGGAQVAEVRYEIELATPR